MQSCPFCNFDAGDRPLQDGRCPQCGSIMQWSDVELAEQPPTSAVEHQDSQPTTYQSTPKSLDDFETPPAQSTTTGEFPTFGLENIGLGDTSTSMNESWRGMTGEPKSDKPQEAERQPKVAEATTADISADTRNHTPSLVSQIWKDSIKSTDSQSNTVKAEQQHETTISDSVFSIQARDVRLSSGSPSTTLDYELLEIIGQGGVGVVYSARQASIDRSVALKMLREEYGHRDEHRDKFLAEAVLTGELDHPNIVPIYDLGRSSSGELFYSMKNVVGTPWDRVVRSKSLRENLDILMKVADAVAFAHSRGVLHRDLKPENVMLGSYGEVLVMDWGIALPTAGFRKSASILRSKAMGGTPAYMAPEMAKGPFEAIGQVSDVYLLGAILFEILTGVPPHDGRDVLDCLENAARNQIRRTEVTGELMDIALKAMSTIPGRRYRKVLDFQAAIRQYQAHSESICLSDKAEEQLTEALATKEYQQFSQAVFAFQEALSLWEDNLSAREGLRRSKLEYAQVALQKGDFELGLSLLDSKEQEHRRLIDDLKREMQDRHARQARLRNFRRVAVGLVGIIVIGGIATTLTIFRLYQDSEANRLNAVSQTKEAQSQKVKAEIERANAEKQRLVAVEQRQEAERQQKAADIARRNAEAARLESVAERRRAEESAYLAETGLIGASIAQNGFSIAKSILQLQAESPSKSRLRHWEWGRFQYLVQGGEAVDNTAVRTTTTSVPLVALDATPSGSLVAVCLGTGECELWNASGELLVKWASGRTLYNVAIHPAGDMLVTCGSEDLRQYAVRVWRLDGQQQPILLAERTMDRRPAAVAFSNTDGGKKIAIGDDRDTARIWDWQQDREPKLLLGHSDVVTAISFSPDDRWVATASLDGSIRIFDSRSGEESQRFNGHSGQVWSLAFAPDGKSIASGGDDQRILLWPVNAGTGPSNVERVKSQVAGKPLPETPYLSLAGHNGTIRDIRFNAQGTRLVSAANDNVVRLWTLDKSNAPESKSIQAGMASLLEGALESGVSPTAIPSTELRGHGGWVHTCLFVGNGEQIISAADDYSWRKWSIDRYRESLILDTQGIGITDLVYHPNGSLVVMALADGSIQLWDSKQQQVVDTLKQGHDYLLSRAAVSADDRLLITAAGDNTLRLWDLRHGGEQKVLQHAGRNAYFNVSPDWRWLVSTGDEKGVAVWEFATDADPLRLRVPSSVATVSSSAMRSRRFSEPTCVAISDDGELIFIGDKEGRCEFWSRGSRQKIHSVAGHAEGLIAAHFIGRNSEQSPIFITAGEDGTVAWWNGYKGEELPRDRLIHNAPLHLAVPALERDLLATAAAIGNGVSRIWVWKLSTGEMLDGREIEGKTIQDISFRRGAVDDAPSLLITTSDSQTSRKELVEWVPNREQDLQPIKAPYAMNSSVWGTAPTQTPNHTVVFGGRGARLWRLDDLQPVMQYRPSSSVTAIAISADGTLLASGNDDGSCIVWDLPQRKPLGTLMNVHQQAIQDLAFAPDGSQLVSVCRGGILGVWSPQALACTAQFALESTAINSVTYSLDGKLLAIAADDEAVRLHDAQTLQLILRLDGHSGPVLCASFSPDRKWLASGAEDKSIRIWSTQTGTCQSVLSGHSAAVTSLAVSSDGLRLLSGSRDTTCKLWDISFLNQASDTSNGQGLGALLTLKQHRSEVVKVAFAPVGVDVLTASADGKGIVWPASRLSPALRLSNADQPYSLGSEPMTIDRFAIVNQVAPHGLANAVLRITLDDEEANSASMSDGKVDAPLPNSFHETLTLDRSDGLLDVQGETVFWAMSQKPIATLRRTTNHILELHFVADIEHTQVQHCVRSVQYQAAADGPDGVAAQTRLIRFELLDENGLSGNATPEHAVINIRRPPETTTGNGLAVIQTGQ